MTLQIDPSIEMPFKILAMQTEIMSRNGSHYTYPVGYRKYIQGDNIAQYVIPPFRGMTFRVFYYDHDNSSRSSMWIAHESFLHTPYAGLVLHNGMVRTGYMYHFGSNVEQRTKYKVPPRSFFSFAVQIIDDKSQKLFLNEEYIKTTDVPYFISDYELKTYCRFYTNDQWVISSHVYDGWQQGNFPSNIYFRELSNFFFRPGYGSSMSRKAKTTARTDNVTIGLKNRVVRFTLDKIIETGTILILTVRLTPKKFVATMNISNQVEVATVRKHQFGTNHLAFNIPFWQQLALYEEFYPYHF
ncbi:uncharacterized protein LOC144110483 [Amblyomma americanum]